jgi:hypothetical protein
MADIDQLSELLHTEGELLQRNRPPERVADLLELGFFEFGASGRIWLREDILAEQVPTAPRAYTTENASAEMLTENIALLTYRVTVNGVQSLRSSIWRCRDGAWRMVFHQGTVVQDGAEGEAKNTSMHEQANR